jgi:transposase-like protein
MASVLSAKHFHDEAAAFAYLEAQVWPDGPVCPQCGGEGYPLKGVKDKKGRERHGLKKCRACRAQFTVRVKTVFESSHVPLHIWLQAVALMLSSKKGVSANQLHRTLSVTLKTAWFLAHRIRMAIAPGGALPPLGGEGKIVEADETSRILRPPPLTGVRSRSAFAAMPADAAASTSGRSYRSSSAVVRPAPSMSR